MLETAPPACPKHLRILVAGLGSIGQRHVRNLHRLAPTVSVVVYRVRGRPLPQDLQGNWLIECDDLETALGLGPAAALVCNPTSLHLSVALAAAHKGCSLLIEKPVSHSLNGLDELQTVVKVQGVRVLVGFQFRFHPGLQAIKRLLDEEAIGRVVCAHTHWGEYLPGWHPWEDYRRSYSARADLGGGVILTLCHPLDYLRWLLGEVKSVSAMAGRLCGLELDVEDTADITLQFGSGAIGTVHLDYVQRPPAHWLQITGQTGTIWWDNADGAVRCYRAETGEEEVFPVPQSFERNTMFRDEMRHFLACVEGAEQPLVTLDDGIQALRIALAAKTSAIEERVIALS